MSIVRRIRNNFPLGIGFQSALYRVLYKSFVVGPKTVLDLVKASKHQKLGNRIP